jgi:uncharacterized membrane protein YfcA
MAADLKHKQKPAEASPTKNYKGFVAGVFSGIAKLSGTCFSVSIATFLTGNQPCATSLAMTSVTPKDRTKTN